MDCTVCLNGDHSFHPTLVTIIVYHTTQQLSSLTNYELKLNPVSFTVKNRLPKLCEQLTFFFFSCAWPLALPRQQLRLVCTSWSTVSYFLPQQPRCNSCLPPLSPDTVAFPPLLQLALLIFRGGSFAVNTLILKLLWVRFSRTNNKL